MTLASPRGIRLSRAWNSPYRRWSGVKVRPATAWTLSFVATRWERDSASHAAPRSIADHPPPANNTVPRALAEVAAATSKKNNPALIADSLIGTDRLHHRPRT